MSELDVEGLLQPIAEEEPCGPNLEYDAAFAEFEAAGQGKPEQQYGDTVIPAEDPDWKQVKTTGVKLLARTMDLRVACALSKAILVDDGWPNFGNVLKLVRGYLETYWETVHPELDPDDGNDPTERVNTIASLADRDTTVRIVRTAPLVSSRMMGKFSLQDVEIAKGEHPPLGDDPAPEMSAIEAAFMDCDLESLQADAAGAREALESVEAIESSLTASVGAGNAINLDRLRDPLSAACQLLEARVAARTGGAPIATEEPAAADDDAPAVTTPDATPAQPAAVPPPAGVGEIRSREDVIKALDRICEYYERTEPSSPLPLLLRRAKSLATKSFLEIVQDLTPDGVAQAQLLGGVTNESEGGA